MAVRAEEEAVKSTSNDRAMYLSNLGNTLQTRFQRMGFVEDLNVAVEANKEAVRITPDNHSGRLGYLHTLTVTLRTHFERTGSMESLNTAIKAITEVCMLVPNDHSSRVVYLNSLGSVLKDVMKRQAQTMI